MFKIRGVDGKDYGPVSADVVREWIRQRRANAQTLVQAEGAADWKPLGALPEFAGALAASAAPQPGAGTAPVPPSLPPQKTSVLAIVALVLGALGLCSGGLLSLVGLPLGIVALLRISKSQGRLGGKAVAIAAVCVSGLFLVLLPALMLPALAKARSKAQAIKCVNNGKQIGLGVRIYTTDHDDKYPPLASWCDTLQSSGAVPQPGVFQCPAHGQSPCGYAFNARLAGKEEGKVSPQTVLFFESDAGWNASGGPELMIPKPRHGGVFVVGLADGSVLQVRPENVGSLRWDP
jgi:hypothetical protein